MGECVDCEEYLMNSIYDVLHALVDRAGLHDLTERAHEIIAEADPYKPPPPPDPAQELADLKAQVAALTAERAAETVPDPVPADPDPAEPEPPVHVGNPF